MSEHHTSVLVVGAGPAGLIAAAQLARFGVHCTILDRRSGESNLPRATAISTRSMEMFRSYGLEEAMLAGSVPVEPFGRQGISVLAAPDKVIEVGFPSAEEASAASPCRVQWIPQDHVEPVLRDHLRSSPYVDVRYHAEVVDVTPGAESVAATVQDLRSGDQLVIHAEYVVAADGAHSIVRRDAGIAMAGDDGLGTFDLIHFRAPLKRLPDEPLYGLYPIKHPDAPGWLIPSGKGDRWFSGMLAAPGKPLLKDRPDDAVDLLRLTTGDPTLEPRIEMIGNFTFAAMLAERYRAGRVFVTGDAAHRMTPRGGMGLNTAIHDGFDLGWRLGWVLSGWDSDRLLDGYESERRPVGEWNVTRSADPYGSRLASAEGFARDLNGRLGHAWITEGEVSTLDVLGPGLTVLTADDPSSWEEAGVAVTPPVHVVRVEPDVARALGVAPGEALVVRPDAKPVGRYRARDCAEAAQHLDAAFEAVRTAA